MKTLFALAVLGGFAASAVLAGISPTLPSGPKGSELPDIPGVPGLARDVVVDLDVAGTPSHDAYGAAGNTILLVDMAAAAGLPSGTPVFFTGIGWDVTLFADPDVGAGSWLSEISVEFNNSTANDPGSIFLRPGAGDAFPGTSFYSSGGVIDLTDVGIPDLNLLDGVMRLEFFESFDDEAGVDDGLWVDGFLHVQVTPEPGSVAMLALGALALLRRR